MNVEVLELPKPEQIHENIYYNLRESFAPPTPSRKNSHKSQLPVIKLEKVTKLILDEESESKNLQCVFYDEKDDCLYELYDDMTYSFKKMGAIDE